MMNNKIIMNDSTIDTSDILNISDHFDELDEDFITIFNEISFITAYFSLDEE